MAARSIARDHDEKRAQILAAAARVFATEGYDRSSMTRLADEVGISKANIYHYYPSKEALLYDILDSHLRSLRDMVLSLDLTGLTAEEQLRAVVRAIMLAYEGYDYKHRIQMNEMALLPDDQQRELRGLQRDLVRFLSDLLTRLAPDRLGGDPAKQRSATMAVFGMLNWYFTWARGAGPADREDYSAVVADMVLGGVKSV
ncbi:TetR/AcrR family transcriptional regulator [Maritimibacter sp. UBA3975]|uniref:TetR/AcrR family transcriptional regulator n=1 Tax=Maritimibacter sp. UBA3975 TaxID=1946833 RepID=UPI000C0B57D9|nr:TetR/AcrR family transcriptional regulator [Maritimibacter sp. UBA3975]MAM61577.1 TetR family transcriptional regulator [Maritimibacter sp.]|tara:strand:- start:3197 stop:3796 length:600 start_codon:yes stop_codon:yes gene_type:complete